MQVEEGSSFEVIDSNFKATLPFVEATIERWSSRYKAVDLGNKKGATMISQIKTQMKDVSSLVKKVQTAPKNSSEDIDVTQCYNDHEFYRQLLTDFLNNTE